MTLLKVAELGSSDLEISLTSDKKRGPSHQQTREEISTLLSQEPQREEDDDFIDTDHHGIPGLQSTVSMEDDNDADTPISDVEVTSEPNDEDSDVFFVD